MEKILLTNDYLELVRKYWPSAVKGDLLAMKVTYNVLNNCGTFKDEIRSAENIDELDELLSGRNPADLLFARGSYFRCKALVEHHSEFLGWQNFRLRAALAGDIPSKIAAAHDYYYIGNTRPREDFPYSPAAFLTDAMIAGSDLVFAIVAATARSANILQDKSQTTITAWWLLHCKYRDYCSKPESMRSLCAFMAPDCAKYKNFDEKIRHEAGTEEIYADANRLAQELDLAVQQRRFDDLGINLVW